jgi:hypothetical protein
MCRKNEGEKQIAKARKEEAVCKRSTAKYFSEQIEMEHHSIFNLISQIEISSKKMTEWRNLQDFYKESPSMINHFEWAIHQAKEDVANYGNLMRQAEKRLAHAEHNLKLC